MREKSNAYRLLVRRSEAKRPLGRSRLRELKRIKLNLVEIE
jgi:hypothetical protein